MRLRITQIIKKASYFEAFCQVYQRDEKITSGIIAFSYQSSVMKGNKAQVTSNKLENNSLFGYRRLIAWQRANELAHLVYDITLNFPKQEIFGITSQLRRAVLSVPTNIVEGHARNSKKEFHRFLSIALGSLAETEYLLEFSFERGLINKSDYGKVSLLRQETGHIIWKLYISQK